MVCVHCANETAVINSRHQKRINQVWRRRACLTCKTVFTTGESIDYSAVWRVKDTRGKQSPFSVDKLFLSLFASCQHRKTAIEDARGLTNTVIGKLSSLAENGVISNDNIVQTAVVALNRFDKAASTHYQAFHQGR